MLIGVPVTWPLSGALDSTQPIPANLSLQKQSGFLYPLSYVP